MPFDVRMPDGTIVSNVPDGTTKEQVLAKYQAASAPEERFSGWESAARGVGEGLTLGGIDELYGGFKALTGDESYEEARDRFRAEQQAAREEDPWTFGVSEVASGFALPGLGAAKVAGGAARGLPRAARAAGIGAGYGGAAGAGYSEGETAGQVAGDVLRGATIGGALGGGLERVTRGLQRARHSAKPETRAASYVADMLKAEGKTAPSVAAILKKNPDARLGDLLGPEGQARMAQLGATDDQLFNILNSRDRNIARKVMSELGDLDELAPKPSGSMFDEAYLTKKPGVDVTQQSQRLFGYLDDAGNEVPGVFTERLNALSPDLLKAAHKSARAGGLKRVKARSASGRAKNDLYQQQVFHRLMSRMGRAVQNPKSDDAFQGMDKFDIMTLRDDIMKEWNKSVGGDFAAVNQAYGQAMGRRRELEPAVELVRTELNKSPAKFFDRIEQGQMDDEVAVALEKLLPAGQNRDSFLEGTRVLRELARTRDALARERGKSPSLASDIDKHLTDVRKDLKNVLQALSFSASPGEHGLAIGAAFRRLGRSLSETIPFVNGLTGGGAVDRRVAETLAGRMVPLAQPATQRPLSRAMATAAGAAGVEAGRERQ